MRSDRFKPFFRFKIITSLAIGSIIIIAVQGAVSAQQARDTEVDVTAVESILFPSEAPNWDHEIAVYSKLAEAAGTLESADTLITDDMAIKQAEDVQQCIAEKLPTAHFSVPKIVEARAEWTMRIGDGNATDRFSLEKAPPPSSLVYEIGKACHEEHMLNIERVLLGQSIPHGSEWFAARDEFLQCIDVEASPEAVADYYSELVNFEKTGCESQYWFLFERTLVDS